VDLLYWYLQNYENECIYTNRNQRTEFAQIKLFFVAETCNLLFLAGMAAVLNNVCNGFNTVMPQCLKVAQLTELLISE